AGARRAADGDAFAGRHAQVERAESGPLQLLDDQHRIALSGDDKTCSKHLKQAAGASVGAPFILAADYVLTGPDPELLLPDQAVLVEEGRILAVDLLSELVQRWPDAEVERLDDCLLMPGFINAHQHGRALDPVQLGWTDDILESWITQRRGRGAPDPYA